MLYRELMRKSDEEIVESYRTKGRAETERIFSADMEYLGHGVNARAYKLRSGNIIRVEPDCNSDGWHKWMTQVVLNDKTDMTARVGFYDTFRDKHSGSTMCVSIQERLYKIRTNVKAYAELGGVGDMIADICRSSDPMLTWKEYAKESKNFDRFFPASEVESFARLVQDSGLYLNDTHMGNVMFRKRGERIILTDPVN